MRTRDAVWLGVSGLASAVATVQDWMGMDAWQAFERRWWITLPWPLCAAMFVVSFLTIVGGLDADKEAQ